MGLPHVDGLVRDISGQPAPHATVTVRDYATGRLSSLYADEVLTAGANPTIANADGHFGFYAKDGTYRFVDSEGFVLPHVTLFGGGARVAYIRKSTQTDVDTDALQDDPTLTISLDDTAVYQVRGYLILFTNPAAPQGIKWRFTATNVTGNVYYEFGKSNPTIDAAGIYAWSDTVDLPPPNGGVNGMMTFLSGIATVSGGVGELHFQLATSAAPGGIASVGAGSVLYAVKIGAHTA